MYHMTQLPAPSDAQLAHSQTLLHLIQAEIAASGGWIPFADYMRLALYAPGLGYYSGPSRKFGSQGDFVTAPETSALFGQSLANTLVPVLLATGGDVLEVGAGSGRLAADVLAALEAQDALPRHYWILELSGDLAARQRELIATHLPHLLDRVNWLTALPTAFRGAIIGNEVLDAMPCRLVRKTEAGWMERGVIWQDGLQWEERPIDAPAALAYLDLPDDYLTELPEEANGFVASLAEAVEAGALILPDYGFIAREFYHPQRTRGTLMCHYRHHAHDDPLLWPGLQDITTHVDFSAIWAAATDAGWQLEGFTSQASFLIDAGILNCMSRLDPDSRDYFRESAAVQKLLSPAEMGELFKVIGFSKNLALEGLLPGFRRDDRSGGL
ncbi:SAM-dependent methyltransferase [Burkholderiaceae bacterium DAT-1]|nr:SAM-dependent methyltransferase [Burkholderiaceae bacterium DAT-1]